MTDRRLDRIALDDGRWTEFVAGCTDRSPFHDPAWATMLADCYRYPAFALVEHGEDGRIVGGAPMLEVRSLRRVRRWVSLPYTDACPPLGEWASAPGLAGDLAGLAGRTRIEAVELRSALPGVEVPGDEGPVIHELALTRDPDEQFKRFHKSQVQRAIRKVTREGQVSVRRAEHPADLTTTFYGLHLATRRRQGAPIQPRRFFELLWERLIARGHGHVLIAETGGTPVAAAVFLESPSTTVYKFGASHSDAWRLRPNHLIFWEAIRTACERGATTFDFGRSDRDNEGLRQFKSSWGAVERPLVYTAVDAAGPHRDASSSRAAELLAPIIRRSPESVCRVIGERLYRYAA